MLRAAARCTFDLVYLDPPFNTGRAQARQTLTVPADADGDRVGFGGRRYRSRLLRTLSYDDAFADYLGFLEPRLAPRAGAAGAARDAVLPHRLPRGALLQAAARRGVRARGVPQRADLELRLRGQAAPPLAGQARHDPGLRARRRAPTTSTPTRSSASRTWRRAWSAPRRRRAASGRPTSGFTRSSPPTGARRPATRPRSPRASCGGWSRRRRGRGDGAWTRSPGSGTLGAVCRELGRRFVLIDENPVAIDVMRERLGGEPAVRA